MKLPSSLKPYFWDSDFNQLNPDGDKNYLIQRLLEYGDMPAVHWLNKHYPKPANSYRPKPAIFLPNITSLNQRS